MYNLHCGLSTTDYYNYGILLLRNVASDDQKNVYAYSSKLA